MDQNYYKIHINQSAVILGKSEKLIKELDLPEDTPSYKFDGKKQVLKVLSGLEKKKAPSIVLLYQKDVDELRKKFFECFNIILAAGGLVVNDSDDILFIYRKGKWDLPKGKIERKEGKKEGGQREVEEETNVKIKMVGKRLLRTYHCYKLDENRWLKKTYWYPMLGKENSKLKPQKEEGITEVRWVHPDELDPYLEKSYPLIKDVLHKYFTVRPKLK